MLDNEGLSRVCSLAVETRFKFPVFSFGIAVTVDVLEGNDFSALNCLDRHTILTLRKGQGRYVSSKQSRAALLC